MTSLIRKRPIRDRGLRPIGSRMEIETPSFSTQAEFNFRPMGCEWKIV